MCDNVVIHDPAVWGHGNGAGKIKGGAKGWRRAVYKKHGKVRGNGVAYSRGEGGGRSGDVHDLSRGRDNGAAE